MNFHARCLCDGPAHRPALVADAVRSRIHDPTGTLSLQRRFSRDLDARWKKLRKLIPEAVAHKTSAVNIISHAASIGDDPVRSFQAWIDEAMRQLVLGGTGAWTLNYVRQAGDAGTQRAVQLTRAPLTRAQDRIPQLQTLCVTELQGVIEAVSQQAVRAFGSGLLTEQPTSKIVRSIQHAIDDVGVRRGRLLAQFFVVRAFGAATLDGFRASGVSRVGTVAERAGLNGSPGLARDAKSKTVFPSRRVTRVERGLQRMLGGGGVAVITAEDDRVCPECEEISEEGPYTLDEAESLIPAHPNCFLPGTLVEGNVLAALKSSYSGPAVEIVTYSGRRLRVTGQHPILTSLGPIAAQDLREGMELVSKSINVGGAFSSNVYKHEHYSPIEIEKVYDAISASGSCAVRPSSNDLHGDASFVNGDVNVVTVDWRLLSYLHSQFAERGSKIVFPFADAKFIGLSALSPVHEFRFGSFASTSRIPSTGALPLDKLATRFNALPLQSVRIGLTSNINTALPKMLVDDTTIYSSIVKELFDRLAGQVTLDQLCTLTFVEDVFRSSGTPHFDTSLFQASVDRSVTYAEFIHQLITGYAGLVGLDDVTSVTHFEYSGHVYDLQTTTGCMLAQGFFTYNCRCAFVPARGDVDDSATRDSVVLDHIVRLSSGQYRLLSHTGKNLGTFATREEAAKHEGEVEWFKANDAVVQDYDPDQPRDDHGMWSGVGGAEFKSWQPPQKGGWNSVEGQDHNIDEPPLPKLDSYKYKDKQGRVVEVKQRLSSGVIMREPDGRTWLIKPTNGFGGYDWTFPKGGVDEGLHPQANAIKEAYEETGLKARITGWAGDYKGDTSVTRMYHAVRAGGHPKDKGWETEQVALAHPDDMLKMLNRSRDKKIAAHHVLGDEFNPDEPRNEQGEWTSGGSGDGTVIETAPTRAMAHDDIKKITDKVASDLGYDKDKVVISDEDKTFELNGKLFHYAGSVDVTPTSNGDVTMYSKNLRPDIVAGVTAHEIEHVKFQSALDAYSKESSAISKDPGPEPNPNGQYYWQKRGGIDGIMTPAGELRGDYPSKYPVYDKLGKTYYNIDPKVFSDADGVSEYSFEYWKAWKENKISSSIAMHETLAEMARIKYETGKFPEHMGPRILSYRDKKQTKKEIDAGAKRWRDLFRTVEELYRARA